MNIQNRNTSTLLENLRAKLQTPHPITLAAPLPPQSNTKSAPSRARTSFRSRGNTFGAVNVGRHFDEAERAKYLVLHPSICERTHRPRKPPRFIPIAVMKLREAYTDWFQTKKGNLAVCLHFPYSIAHTQDVEPTAAIEKEINWLLKGLAKRVFSKTNFVRRRAKLQRLVVLERAEGVGLHIHMVVQVPGNIMMGKVIRILRELWERFWNGRQKSFTTERVFWAEPISGNYFPYSVKQIGADDIGTDCAQALLGCSHF